MIDNKAFFDTLASKDINFFAGVPDSLLKNFCHYIADHSENHYITSNEGAAISLGIGHHLATGKIPCIYLQNSGLGHIMNPLLSMADPEVYSIPMLILMGWRGEPGIADEPQHFQQGNVTLPLLGASQIDYDVLPLTHDRAIGQLLVTINNIKSDSKPHILVVRKGSFAKYSPKQKQSSHGVLNRESCIATILDQFQDAKFFATTGYTGRELFEVRKQRGESHAKDFLGVGGMGHINQVALGYSFSTTKKVVCLDGDGSLLMHMGSMALNGQYARSNFIHVVFNNGMHQSVGGQPTVGENLDFTKIAQVMGYKNTYKCESEEDFNKALAKAKGDGPYFIEVKISDQFRDDLGRPDQNLKELKQNFMRG